MSELSQPIEPTKEELALTDAFSAALNKKLTEKMIDGKLDYLIEEAELVLSHKKAIKAIIDRMEKQFTKGYSTVQVKNILSSIFSQYGLSYEAESKFDE